MWIEENLSDLLRDGTEFLYKLNEQTICIVCAYKMNGVDFFLFGLIYMSISFELKIHLDLEHDEFKVKIWKTEHAKPRYAMIWHS